MTVLTILVIVGFVLCGVGFLYLNGQIAFLQQQLKALARPDSADTEAKRHEANRLLDLEARAARLEERLADNDEQKGDSVSPYSGPSGFRRS